MESNDIFNQNLATWQQNSASLFEIVTSLAVKLCLHSSNKTKKMYIPPKAYFLRYYSLNYILSHFKPFSLKI